MDLSAALTLPGAHCAPVMDCVPVWPGAGGERRPATPTSPTPVFMPKYTSPTAPCPVPLAALDACDDALPSMSCHAVTAHGFASSSMWSTVSSQSARTLENSPLLSPPALPSRSGDSVHFPPSDDDREAAPPMPPLSITRPAEPYVAVDPAFWDAADSVTASYKSSVSPPPSPRGPSPSTSSASSPAVSQLIRFMSLVSAVASEGMSNGMFPSLTDEVSTGGAYFLRDASGTAVCVFKPSDEEPYAPNNPKGRGGPAMGGPGIKNGVLVGEGAVREAAAFLLDGDGVIGVPPTVLASARHPGFRHPPVAGCARRGEGEEGDAPLPPPLLEKQGSLQLFASHTCTADDVGPALLPQDAVQRLAIFDIRVCNLDRNEGNILIRAVPEPVGGGSTSGPLSPAVAAPLPPLSSSLLAGDVPPSASKASSSASCAANASDNSRCSSPFSHGTVCVRGEDVGGGALALLGTLNPATTRYDMVAEWAHYLEGGGGDASPLRHVSVGGGPAPLPSPQESPEAPKRLMAVVASQFATPMLRSSLHPHHKAWDGIATPMRTYANYGTVTGVSGVNKRVVLAPAPPTAPAPAPSRVSPPLPTGYACGLTAFGSPFSLPDPDRVPLTGFLDFALTGSAGVLDTPAMTAALCAPVMPPLDLPAPASPHTDSSGPSPLLAAAELVLPPMYVPDEGGDSPSRPSKQPSPSLFGPGFTVPESAKLAVSLSTGPESVKVPKLSRRHSFDGGPRRPFPAGAPPKFFGARRPKGSSGGSSDCAAVNAVRSAHRVQLVPIDHGLILPHFTALDDVQCTWLYWKQVKAPLSPELTAYVAGLDGRADAWMLRSVLGDAIRMECLLTLRLCTQLLQQGVAGGLTLHDIACMMCRDQDDTKPSALELAISKARRATHTLREHLGLALAREEEGEAVTAEVDPCVDPALRVAAVWDYHDALIAAFKLAIQPHIDAVLAKRRS